MIHTIRIAILQRRYDAACKAEAAYSATRGAWHLPVALAYQRRANLACCKLARALYSNATR